MDFNTWKYVIEHDASAESAFTQAKEQVEQLQRSHPDASIQIAPASVDGPNVVRFKTLGHEIMVGVLFGDGKILCSVTAPQSLAWAKAVAEAQVHKFVKNLLHRVGATTVRITEYR